MCPICFETTGIKSVCKANLGFDFEYDLLECPSCGVRYLSPIPTEQQLAAFYRPQYYGSDWYKQFGSGTAFAKSTLRKLQPGKFLDVGCGLGYFIDGIAKNSEWQVAGFEFSLEAAAFARENLNLDVSAGDLADFERPSGGFDYIQIRNVLEHVTEPLALLKECRRLMAEDGTLHLFVPNGPVDSADLIRFHETEGRAGFSKSGHLLFFSRESLFRLFEDSDFSLVRSRTLGLRRGLAILGYWPRKKKWKEIYGSRLGSVEDGDGQINLPPKKNRPDIYYRYRQFRMNAKMLSGMKSWGLDFELLLKPKRN